MALINGLSLFLLACGTTVASAIPSRPKGTLVVNTTSGRYSPYLPEEYPDLASFPDIPYAETPIGSLRFAPPVLRTTKSHQISHSTQLPAGCFQYMLPGFKDTVVYSDERSMTFQRGDFANTTEDCLRLSIFGPKHALEVATSYDDAHKTQELLPVIIWIHGGGYSFGGTNTPYQLAPSWVQRSQKHLVVQVQYRLNLFGFPNAAGLAENGKNLNLGLLDQRVAVEWVRANIARFGGDPDRISLWGESAGAYGTDGYLFAWAKDPIVKGVMANSGNALAIGAYTVDPTNHTVFSTAAKRLGCGNLSPAQELACMRQVPASKIQTYIQANTGDGGAADDGLSFGVVPDNVTIFNDYVSRIRKNSDTFPAAVPLLIGTNADEGTVLIPYNFNGSATATQLPAALAPVAQAFRLNLQCTTLQEANLRASAGATTYQYLYAGNFTNISPRPWLGAYHGSELPMIFGTSGIEGKPTDFESRVSKRMQDLYLAFATDPSNGLKAAGWPSVSADEKGHKIVEWAANGREQQVISTEKLQKECSDNGF